MVDAASAGDAARSGLLDVAPLAAQHRDAYRQLMDAAGLACFCRYWHFAGTKNDWLERSALRPEENEADAFADPDHDTTRGLVAQLDGELVGWLKIAPTTSVPKLLAQPVYRKLPLARDGVHAVVCFLVHPDARGRGVARALVQAAPAFAKAHGASVLQAYPRRASYRIPDEQAFAGPESLFLSEGFTAVHDDGPYPVFERRLG